MELFLQGELIHSKKEGFKDKTSGEEVSFFKYTFADASGDTLTLNSKKDFSKLKGQPCVARLRTSELAVGHKLSLVDCERDTEPRHGTVE